MLKGFGWGHNPKTHFLRLMLFLFGSAKCVPDSFVILRDMMSSKNYVLNIRVI